jgi:hypothetical protein
MLLPLLRAERDLVLKHHEVVAAYLALAYAAFISLNHRHVCAGRSDALESVAAGTGPLLDRKTSTDE